MDTIKQEIGNLKSNKLPFDSQVLNFSILVFQQFENHPHHLFISVNKKFNKLSINYNHSLDRHQVKQCEVIHTDLPLAVVVQLDRVFLKLRHQVVSCHKSGKQRTNKLIKRVEVCGDQTHRWASHFTAEEMQKVQHLLQTSLSFPPENLRKKKWF